MAETERCVCAIDPGLGGSIAFLFPSAPDRVAVEDLPTVAGEVDIQALRHLITTMDPVRGAVELVGPMPQDGAAQAFKFGLAYGTARAALALASVPYTLVTPQTWKRHHRLIGKDDPKEASRALAIRLFPASADRFARKKDHGRAEAALLAAYAVAPRT